MSKARKLMNPICVVGSSRDIIGEYPGSIELYEMLAAELSKLKLTYLHFMITGGTPSHQKVMN